MLSPPSVQLRKSLCLLGNSKGVIEARTGVSYYANTKETRARKSGKGDFAVARLLGKIVKGKALFNLLKGATLFRQGEEADAIYFIQNGKVRLSVVSKQGKKAIFGVIGPVTFWAKNASSEIPAGRVRNQPGTINGIPGSEAGHAPGDSSATRVFRRVRGFSVSPQRQHGGRSLRSTLQPQRVAAACALLKLAFGQPCQCGT